MPDTTARLIVTRRSTVGGSTRDSETFAFLASWVLQLIALVVPRYTGPRGRRGPSVTWRPSQDMPSVLPLARIASRNFAPRRSEPVEPIHAILT